MIKIPVKIGIEMLFINLFIAVLLFIPMEDGKERWISYAIFLGSILFLNYLIFSVKYYIQDGIFYVKNSFFGTQKISIEAITNINRTSNLVSAPAPSITGRVQIFFGKDNTIISPKNYEDFKDVMLRINPKIVFK
jgi:hypothetical protein